VLRPRRAGNEAGDDAALVEAAQRGDRASRERLITAFVPLVLRTGSRLTGRYLRLGEDEEVSVGLEALNEAVDRWRRDLGAPFAVFAEMVVRRRLIDHFRRERARREVPASEFEQEDEEGETWNPLEAVGAAELARDRQDAEDRRVDVARLLALLAEYGIRPADLARATPQHRDARARAVQVARAVATEPAWRDYLRRQRALPLKELEAAGTLGVSRKTMERQRKFIIAVALILMEGLDSLRPYVEP
jgi:RNA polymerase sigma factor